MAALALSMAVGLGATGCGEEQAAPGKPGPATSATGQPAPATAEASSSPVRWVAVTAAAGHPSLRLPARVVADGASSSALRPPTNGQVVSLAVRVGDTVKRGQRIATVAHPELAVASATLRGLARQLTQARSRLARVTRLRRDGLARRDEEFAVKATVAVLETRRATLKAQLLAARDPSCGVEAQAGPPSQAAATPVCAPADGVVRAVAGRVGAMAGPDFAPIATLWHQPPARVEVRHPRPPPAVVSLRFETPTGRVVQLRPAPLSSLIDPDDGATLAWHTAAANQSDATKLTPGLRGEVVLSLAADAVVVPDSALQRHGVRVTVIRRRASEVQRVAVQVFSRDGGAALVRGSELTRGDHVAANAALLGELADVAAPSAQNEPENTGKKL